MSYYPPSQPPQPQPGGGWDPNAGWAPAPAPAPEQPWTPPQQQPAPAGWQTQPGGYGTPPPGIPGGAPVTKQGRGPVIWIALAVAVVAALGAAGYLLFVADSAGASDPEGVVRSYYNAAVDRDCEKMLDYIDLAASNTDRQTALGLCQEAYSGGEAVPTKLNSIEVKSESGDTATVTVSYETAEGSESEEVNLNKVDGDWKINLGDIGANPPESTTTTEGGASTTEGATSTTEEATTTTEGTASTEEPSGSLTPPPADSPEMSDPALAELANNCGAGDMSACDQLFWDSELGGDLETYAKTCGGLVPEGGASDQCVSRFGENVAAG